MGWSSSALEDRPMQMQQSDSSKVGPFKVIGLIVSVDKYVINLKRVNF